MAGSGMGPLNLTARRLKILPLKMLTTSMKIGAMVIEKLIHLSKTVRIIGWFLKKNIPVMSLLPLRR